MLNLNIPGYWPPVSGAADPILLGLQVLVYAGILAVVVLAVVLVVRRRTSQATAAEHAVEKRWQALAATPVAPAVELSRAEAMAAERAWARQV